MSPGAKVVQRLPKPKIPRKNLPKRKRKTTDKHHLVKNVQPKRKSATPAIILCPNCGSSNLSWNSDMQKLWSVWACKRCGFRGALISRNSMAMKGVREASVKRTLKP